MTLQEVIINSLTSYENNIAIKSNTRDISYKNINEQSDIIANHLFTNGMTGSAVGVFFNDKIDFIISIIGILKAQCIFTPVDIENPKSRIYESIELLDLNCIIYDKALEKKLSKLIQDLDIKKDCYSDLMTKEFETNSSTIAYTQEDLIYIYLKSSFNGLQAIAGKNKSLLNASNWIIEEFKLNRSTKTAFFSDLFLEKSLFDIFPVLISGGTINIPDNNIIGISDNTDNTVFSDNEEPFLHENNNKNYPIIFSNDSIDGIEEQLNNLKGFLENNSNTNLTDISYSLSLLDTNAPFKSSFICSDVNDLVKKINDYSIDPTKIITSEINEDIVFLFAGLGSQYHNMGLGLYESYPEFKNAIDECCEIVSSITDVDIKSILYPKESQVEKNIINSIDISQLVIFIFEYSLAKLLMSLGIVPKVLIGYSFGEYIAAAISEVFTLTDILKLIVLRGKLLKKIPSGRMLSIPLDISKVELYLNKDISLAINNGVSCIVSGKIDAIELLEKKLRGERVICYRLSGERAIHSFMMDEILDEFGKELNNFTLNEPKIPILSNLTGDYVKKGEMTNHQYWIRHLRNTVIFEKGIKELIKFENGIFIEIGPGRDLCNLLSYYTSKNHKSFSLVRNESREITDEYFLIRNIEKMWQLGVSVKWDLLLNTGKSKKIEIFKQSEGVINWLESKDVNFLLGTTSLLEEFIKIDNSEKYLENLANILLFEEGLYKILIKKYFEKFDNSILLYNLFGHSETGIINSYHKITLDDLNKPGIPIGKNIKGVRLIILDNNNHLCNEDQVGRVFIRTPFRSAGYYKKGELSEKCFIQNPYNENPKDLIFQTNNYGKLQDDGNLFLLDKIDKRKIKILNRDVHLGEIDTIVESFPEIEKSYTIYSNNNKAYKLYNFFTANKSIDSEILKDFVAEKLPFYMCPDFLIQTNYDISNDQEIDENKLIEIAKVSFEGERSFSVIEKKLVDLWADTLNIEASEISSHSDYFELGGHSIKAISLISKIFEKFRVNLTLNDLFNNSTFRSLFNLIETSKKVNFHYIPVNEKREYYYLSSAQKRLFFLYKMYTNNILYNMPQVIRLDEKTDRNRIEEILTKYIERHASFRTSFQMRDSEPIQIIHNSVNFKLNYLKIEQKEIHETLNNLVKPFDLEKAPLIRASYIEVDDSERILFIDMHHIICDAYSRKILSEEFSSLISGNEIPKLKLQYTDYVDWRNSKDQVEKLVQQQQYWIEKFNDDIPILNLPTDFPRPKNRSLEAQNKRFRFNSVITNKLKSLYEENEVTLYMGLLSKLYIFLSKMTGQRDIVIGTPTAGRNHYEIESIIGIFVNTLALRNKVDEKLSYIEFLENIKNNTINDFDNQDYQFEELVEKVVKERETNRNPMFDVMFNLQNVRDFEVQKEINEDYETPEFQLKSKFDISFTVYEINNELLVDLVYSSDLFESKSIEHMIDCFRNIVDSIISVPKILIKDIEIISEKEIEQIQGFNKTQKDFPNDKNVIEFFKEQVLQRPQDNAVVYGNKRLTYKELDLYSDNIAREIIKEKEENEIIAICVKPSLEMVIGILGIIKSGAGFIPIDITFPKERKVNILKNSGCSILITDNLDESIDFGGIEIVINNDHFYEQEKSLEININANDVLYTIYTSGSTGRPKGVKISHRNLINYFTWFKDEINANSEDKYLVSTSYAFDAIYTQFFASLLSGGELHVISKETYMSPGLLLQYIDIQAVTVLHMTPSLFNLLICDNGFNNNVLSKVRLLILGGESINVNDVETVKKMYNSLNVMNHYGPTETTIASITKFINNSELQHFKEKPTIGKPIQNTECYIVDRDNNIRPIGFKGELCISGEGVALGYINNHELTKEKFVLNPFKKNGLMYRTGDLARWLTDGNIEFLGRIDNQVKIRGNRIELEEINYWLLKHEQITEAVVVVKEKSEDKFLVGYYVSKQEFSSVDLRSYLATLLPDYMIPLYFIHLTEMPLTSNGKINLKLLPDFKIQKDVNFKSAQSSTEKKLVKIWAEVLNIEKKLISIDKSFFELGGHSIKAISLISKIEQEFSIKLSLIELFDNPTISLLLSVIKEGFKETYEIIKNSEKREYYKVSAAQQRLFFLQQVDLSNTVYHTTTLLQVKGEINKDRFESTFKKLIERHNSLRTSFHKIDKEIVQRINSSVDFNINYFDGTNENIDSLVSNIIQPFNLDMAPVFRVNLIKKEHGNHILMIDMHHIITDALSRNIFVEDFIKIYSNEKLGKIELQYNDFSEWQGKLFKSVKIKAQEEFWLNQFKDKIPELNIKTDFERPEEISFKGKQFSIQISDELLKSIKKHTKETNSTINIFLLSIYYIFLWKYTGQSDLIIGSVIHGRRHSSLEKIIGFFVNMLPLYSKISGEKEFNSYLEEVRELSLNAYNNQDYQFEQLIKKLEVPRKKGRHTLVETVLTYREIDNESNVVNRFKEDNLEFSYYNQEFDRSHFDLLFDFGKYGDTLVLNIEYSSDLFNKATIVKFANHYVNIMEQVLLNPNINLEKIILSHDLIEASATVDVDDDWNI